MRFAFRPGQLLLWLTLVLAACRSQQLVQLPSPALAPRPAPDAAVAPPQPLPVAPPNPRPAAPPDPRPRAAPAPSGLRPLGRPARNAASQGPAPAARPSGLRAALSRPRPATRAATGRAPRLSKGSWLQIAAWVLGIGGIGLGIVLGGWLGLLVALLLVVPAILLGLTGSFFNGNLP